MADITTLLRATDQGDREAESQLYRLVYDELHRIAAGYLRKERPGVTLQATELVNAAYLRLVDKKVAWKSRRHFYVVAAKAMRQLLVDRARRREAQKRGGNVLKTTWKDGIESASDRQLAIDCEEFILMTISVDHALGQLQNIDNRLCQLIELRFFSGHTIEQAAEIMALSLNRKARLGNGKSVSFSCNAVKIIEIRRIHGIGKACKIIQPSLNQCIPVTLNEEY